MKNVRVILKAEVKSLGKPGDVVNVSSGYARNFLFLRGLAQKATVAGLNELEAKKKLVIQKEEETGKEAEGLAKKLEALDIEIEAKTGEEDKLFGSVTSKDIADAIFKASKIEIDKKKILLKENIKSVGEYVIDVKVHPDVSAKVKIQIKPQSISKK